MRKELQILDEFIKARGLRHTAQRETVLNTFLSVEGHVSVEELHRRVAHNAREIGYTTVYRTMKLLLQLGLCRVVDFGDGVARFEHEYGHEHHDHLICTECGVCIEVFNPRIERLQDSVARKAGFTPTSHTLKIYGICARCGKRPDARLIRLSRRKPGS